MDSLTDEQNTWFNAVRLEDSHDYLSAALSYMDDAARCLGKGLYVRAAMSVTCAASCLTSLGDIEDAVQLYSGAASLYEHNADVGMAKSMRESLWSMLHAFEYYTLVSDHVNAERVSKKYADLARRIDRFETKTVFEALKSRRESVLMGRLDIGSSPVGRSTKLIPHINKINRAVIALLQQLEAVTEAVATKNSSIAEINDDEEEESLVYETEQQINERRIVS